jgi:hypothetical protein
MACSSATLLAPSVSFSENILRNIFPDVNDRELLRMMRITMVCFAGLVLLFALNSESSIFEMVENAYKITLAGAFVPLFFGAYWSRATTQGALMRHHRRRRLLADHRTAGRRSQPGAAATDRSWRQHRRHDRRLAAAAAHRPPDTARGHPPRPASPGAAETRHAADHPHHH